MAGCAGRGQASRPQYPCGTTTGPFREVGGLFPLLMCEACRAVRSGPAPEPDELVVHPNPREPYLQWGCPLAGCDYGAELPWPLERHATAEHPEWAATFEDDRWRVIYRRT
jgi:hypothetical protein